MCSFVSRNVTAQCSSSSVVSSLLVYEMDARRASALCGGLGRGGHWRHGTRHLLSGLAATPALLAWQHDRHIGFDNGKARPLLPGCRGCEKALSHPTACTPSRPTHEQEARTAGCVPARAGSKYTCRSVSARSNESRRNGNSVPDEERDKSLR